jgi:S-adenosylmethionine decarboxylase
MFGPHLVLEGYNCQNSSNLGSKDAVKRFLSEFPAKINMTTIMSPQVMHYDGGDIPEDNGISGFVIIAESHIAIHTFAEKNFFTLDIFSCKPFDIELAIKHVLGFFAPANYDHQIFDRGREFPRSFGKASEIIKTERSQLQLNNQPKMLKV